MNVLATWNKMSVRPFGKWLFSRAVSFKAPYFASIKPRFEDMKPGYAKVLMKKRRSVENHIGTVHAIACCNLAEVAAGTLLEASLPKTMRWLPRSMNVQYLKKAETDLVAIARVEDYAEGPARDVVVAVDIQDANGQVVVHADIAMYVSPKKKA
jgi:uncharacterized protein (TIGR00369 family)